MENYTLFNNSYKEEVNEDGILEYTRYIFISFMVLVTMIGIPGNITVVAVLTKLRDKASTDYYVLTMSVTDLLSAAVNTTCFIFRYEPSIWRVLASVLLCRLHVFWICVTIIATTLLLAATAYDRYRKTSKSSITDTLTAVSRSRRICVGVISLSFIYGTIYPFTITLDPTTLQCVPLDNYRGLASMFSSILALVFIFMFIVVIVCYTKISILLRRHHKLVFQLKTNNPDAYKKNQIWNRKSKVHPLNIDTNTPSTSKRNSANSYELNELSTKETTIQNVRLQQQDHRSVHSKHSVETKNRFLINGHSIAVEMTNHEMEPHKTTSNCDLPTHIKPGDTNTSNSNQTRYNARQISAVEKDRKKINVTTLMMFLVTVIYVTTWIVNWSTQIYKAVSKTSSLKGDFLTERLYMINCMTNPILYMIMSTKFRQKARDIFCKT